MFVWLILLPNESDSVWILLNMAIKTVVYKMV